MAIIAEVSCCPPFAVGARAAPPDADRRGRVKVSQKPAAGQRSENLSQQGVMVQITTIHL
ncbi:protein of unknown function [Azospirillum baldaniorum]|uniref:Uncharacterized protein n=1 Tax=Azospirillum baldaniorum TaxID=1064539 RepID=A0A9P1JSV0_9PROT|nr:protein of unknown function [Azospirillum baldaniorum]